MARVKEDTTPPEAGETKEPTVTEGTLYVFPNWNGSGKSIRVTASNRTEAAEKAKAEAKKGQA